MLSKRSHLPKAIYCRIAVVGRSGISTAVGIENKSMVAKGQEQKERLSTRVAGRSTADNRIISYNNVWGIIDYAFVKTQRLIPTE